MTKTSLAVLLLLGCSKAGPTIDQKGKIVFYWKGKKSIVDNVEYGLEKEMSDPAVMGRKDPDGTRHPVVAKARFATKKFSADGLDVTADFANDMGKMSGSLQLGDQTCEITRVSKGTGSISGTEYDGFTGTCTLDGKDRDFTLGIVK